jgi:DNA repair protein RadC
MKTISNYSLKKEPTNVEVQQISSPHDAQRYMRQFWGDDIEVYESFFLVLLNRANQTIGYVKISQGGIVGTVVDVKIIAKYVIDSLASACMVAHNHPSGNLKPSEADIKITARLKGVLDLLECKLIDHVILTKESYYSFSENDIL